MGRPPSSLHLPNELDFWHYQFCELKAESGLKSLKQFTRRSIWASWVCVSVRGREHILGEGGTL